MKQNQSFKWSSHQTCRVDVRQATSVNERQYKPSNHSCVVACENGMGNIRIGQWHYPLTKNCMIWGNDVNQQKVITLRRHWWWTYHIFRGSCTWLSPHWQWTSRVGRGFLTSLSHCREWNPRISLSPYTTSAKACIHLMWHLHIW